MSRSTFVLIGFVLVIAAIVGISFFLKNQPIRDITIAVDPLALDWAKKAAEEFNASSPMVQNGTQPIRIQVISKTDLDVWLDNPWSIDNHPDGWLASSSASVSYSPGSYPFRIVKPSTAMTPLVWGGLQTRMDILTADGMQPLDWNIIADAASKGSWQKIGGDSSWGYLNIAVNAPSSSMAGLGVPLSAAASFHESPTLSRQELNDQAFIKWFNPVIEAMRNARRIGGNPAEALGGARGSSAFDIAILPESQWLTALNVLSKGEAVSLSYPPQQYILDFPLSAWQDTQQADPIATEAVKVFGDFLLSATGQSLAADYGLRPVSGLPEENLLFTRAANLGIQLEPVWDFIVNNPNHTEAERLSHLFD